MKKILLALAVAAVAVMAIPLGAVAGNAPANNVAGSMMYQNGTYGWANFTFAGQDVGAPAADKGTAFYADKSGYYFAKATDVVVVDRTTARMSLQVTYSTHPAVPAGFQFTVTLHDNGVTGINDYFTFAGVDNHFMVKAGNILVSYR